MQNDAPAKPMALPAVPRLQKEDLQVSEFTNNCAALDIKPNSSLAANPLTFTNSTTVDFTRNYVGGHGFEALTSALYRNQSLEVLLIPNNGLSNESVVFFAKMFVNHPKLHTIDLSGNPISLPASVALTELVQKNKRIEDIRLDNTLIDVAVVRKIKRALNLRKPHAQNGTHTPPPGSETATLRIEPRIAPSKLKAKQLATAAAAAGESPYAGILKEFEPKRAAAKASKIAASRDNEAYARLSCGQVVERKNAVAPAVDHHSGWTLVNIAVLCAPAAHVAELEAIKNQVIPQLNAAFESQQVFFSVLSNFTEPAHAATYGRLVERMGVAVDFTASVYKAAPFVVELLGDNVGLLESPVITNPRDKASASSNPTSPSSSAALTPLLYLEHKAATSIPESLLVVMQRGPTRTLGIPPPLTPLVSDDPRIIYPDMNASAVRNAVAKAHGVPTLAANFDYNDAIKKYEEHHVFRQSALAGAGGPELVVRSYPAVFDKSNQIGQVLFKGLDIFVESLYQRLHGLATAMFKKGPRQGLPRLPAFLTRCLELSIAKKNILGKIDLYTVSPPSRNLLLLHGPTGAARTTTIGASVSRALKKPSNVVLTHFTRNIWLTEEPSDRRCMFLHLLSQLSADRKPFLSAEKEIDVERVEQIFTESLSKATAALEDGKILTLFIDGVDDLDAPVPPSVSLRVSETGVDVWRPSMVLRAQSSTIVPASSSAAPLAPTPPPTSKTIEAEARASENALLNFLPLCLARNLRIVLSVDSDSACKSHLESRGRDSCESLTLVDTATNEAEQVLVVELKKININLTDEEIGTIRSKEGCKSAEYINFVVDMIRRRSEEPSYQTQLNLIETLPPTVSAMCTHLMLRLESDFGVPLMKRAYGLLISSRWGLLECELDDLLSRDGKSKLPQCDLNKLLRLLRSVLHSNSNAGQQKNLPHIENGANALHCIVALRCRAFIDAVKGKYFLSPTSDSTLPYESYHLLLAHHYRRIIEKKSHPLFRRAAREFSFHAILGKRWTMLFDSVASLEYISMCYSQGLGYELQRELIRGYNAYEKDSEAQAMDLAEKLAADGKQSLEAIGSQAAAALQVKALREARLAKLKDYVYFVRDHNVNLVQFPHMVHQIAIGCSADSYLHQDAVTYFTKRGDQPHLVVVNRTKGKLHREAVTGVLFAPNGLRIATCSDDRSVRITNLFGESLLQICQSGSKLKRFAFSSTSRYIAAAAEDRTIFVFDATNGQLVSKFGGHQAAIRTITLSARGRYTATGGDDRTMKVYETETGALLANVPHNHFVTSATNIAATLSCIVSHPIDELKFFSCCDTKVLGWTLNMSDSRCDEVICIQGHRTNPISQIHLTLEGSYVIAVAGEKPTAAAPSTIRAEESIKVFSAHTGRHLATLLRGKATASGQPANVPGVILTSVSPCERFLASALIDGRVQLHKIDCRSYTQDENSAPIEVLPTLEFPAFRNHTIPTVTQILFSFDSSRIIVAGNERQIKLLSIEGIVAGTANAERYPLEPIAEFLMEQPITSISSTMQPQHDGAEIAVGDSVGRVLCIALKKEHVAHTNLPDGDEE